MSDETKIPNSQSDAGPAATRSTVPMWFFSLTVVLLYLGAIYFDHHGGWFDAQVYAPYANAEELDSYQPKSGAAEAVANGRTVYERNCGICHGPDGAGKPGQAPPLAGSEWVNAKGFNRIVEIPQLGLNGTITVKGQQMTFTSGMAPMGAALSDSDLADVLTYIRNSWGNKNEPVTAADVKSVRAAIVGHPAINGEQGLDAIKE